MGGCAPGSAALGQMPPGMLMRGQVQMMQALQQPWTQDLEAGQSARQAKDWATAQTRTLAALEAMDAHAAQHPDQVGRHIAEQRMALITLAEAARAQGTLKDALPHLERLVSLEDAELANRMASGNPGLASMTTAEAVAVLQSVFRLAGSSAAHLNRSILTSEMEGSALEEALAERLPETALTLVTLANTYAELGMREKALAVFDGPFKRFMQRQTASANPAAGQTMHMSLEAACLRMAMALARLGRSEQADQAFACALQESAKNYVELGVKGTMGLMHDAAAGRRRLLVGTYASYVFLTAGAGGQQNLLALVAETKGASNRYRERRRAIWAHSSERRLARAREQFTDHERRLTDMRMQGSYYVEAMAAWMNEEHALMATYARDFQNAGIQDVFSPGEQILARSRSKLEADGQAQGGGEALIGYSVYRPVDFSSQQLKPARMLRYVLSKDGEQVMDMGAVSDLNRLARQWRGDIVAGKGGSSDALAELLLGRLPEHARLARSWVIDPDGTLSVLPFEALALPGAGGQRVIDRHTLRYVTSIAEFADPTSTTAPVTVGSGSAVIVADPVFASAGSARAGEQGITRELRTVSGATLRNLQLQPLPETREEARQVAAALTQMGLAPQLYTGEQATVDAFSFREAPRYLHVATHGIFLEPGITLANQGYVRLASALPGLQSALALSASDKGSILTGADITRLNLRGTELVVFSACDTGNGEIEAGEGVASLRRAVEEAGARSSITSLWPVPSQATAHLMADFYARLATGQSKSEALREAKLTLMKTSPSPLHWAGFLLAGEP